MDKTIRLLSGNVEESSSAGRGPQLDIGIGNYPMEDGDSYGR